MPVSQCSQLLATWNIEDAVNACHSISAQGTLAEAIWVWVCACTLASMGLQTEEDELGFGAAGPPRTSKPKSQPKRKGRTRSRGRSPTKSQSGSPKRGRKKRRTADQRSDVEKRCRSCKKKKPESAFYAAQADCKECSHVVKNVMLAAQRQGEREWYDGLSEVEKDNMRKAYLKLKERCDKECGRVRFNVKKYKEELQIKHGVRFEGRHRFMDEKQYVTFPRSEKGGDMTKAAAEANWKRMIQDPVYMKKGRKVAVPIHEDVISFGELSKARAVEAEQKLGNKMTDAEVEQKFQNLAMSGGGALGKGLDFDSMGKRLASADMDEDYDSGQWAAVQCVRQLGPALIPVTSCFSGILLFRIFVPCLLGVASAVEVAKGASAQRTLRTMMMLMMRMMARTVMGPSRSQRPSPKKNRQRQGRTQL